MPTILTHPAVAVALWPSFRQQNFSRKILVAGSICASLPDIDVIGFRYGIHYGDVLGHRGLTHSITFALIVSAILSFALSQKRKKLFAFFFLCIVSHGVLDAFTNGGLGVAFFSPFNNTRYFFPWQPIEVSPIGIVNFLSGPFETVLWSEIQFVWVPCVAIYIATAMLQKRT